MNRNMFSMPCTRRRSRRWSRPYSTLCFKYSCLKQLHMDTAACANTFRPSVSSSPICLQYWTIWVWTLVFFKMHNGTCRRNPAPFHKACSHTLWKSKYLWQHSTTKQCFLSECIFYVVYLFSFKYRTDKYKSYSLNARILAKL